MTTSDGSQNKPRNRKCGNCRFYEPAPLWRKGWCRNPKLYPPHANHLVDATTIDCEGGFRSRIYWEPVTAGQSQPETKKIQPAPNLMTRQPAEPLAPTSTSNYAPTNPRPVAPPPSAQMPPVYRQPTSVPTNPDYQSQPPLVAPNPDATRGPLVNRFRRTQQEIDDIETRARAEAETELRRVDYSTPPSAGPVSNYAPRPTEQPTAPFNSADYRTRPEPETRPFPVAPANPPTSTGQNPLNSPAAYQPPAVEPPATRFSANQYQPPVVEPPAPASYNNWPTASRESAAESYNNYGTSRPAEPPAYSYQGQPQPEQIAEAEYKFIDTPPTEPASRIPKVIVRPDRGRPPLEPISQPYNLQSPGPRNANPLPINLGDLVKQAQQKWAALPPVKVGSRIFSGQQVILGVIAAFLIVVVLLLVFNGGNKNTPLAGSPTTTPGLVARGTTTASNGTPGAIVSTTVAVVTTPAATTAPATTAPAQRTALVSGNGETPLNMRDAPAIKGKIVATIKEGEKVVILEGPQEADGRVWYKIDYNGKIGWAVRDYLKL